MIVNESVVSNFKDIPNGGDWVNNIPQNSILYCLADVTAMVEDINGNQSVKAMVAGEYWKVRPHKVIAPTVNTLQMHW